LIPDEVQPDEETLHKEVDIQGKKMFLQAIQV
jgi:hypothetical protein